MRPGQRFLRCAGTLGWALPAAIGAKCAVPDRPVVCWTGDGGLYYHLAELETAARNGINVVIVVNNNRSLSQDMKIFQNSWGGADKITSAGDKMWMFDEVNLANVAAGLGCASYRVESPAEIGVRHQERARRRQAGRGGRRHRRRGAARPAVRRPGLLQQLIATGTWTVARSAVDLGVRQAEWVHPDG